MPGTQRRVQVTPTAVLPVSSVATWDVVVWGGAAALLLQPPDALPDLGEAFLSARPGQAFGEPIQGLFETLPKALGHGLFLLGPLAGIAVQAGFLAILVHRLVQMQVLARGRPDRDRRLGIELPVALAAHHQIAVSGLAQPGDALLGGDAPIHHHQGVAGGLERLPASEAGSDARSRCRRRPGSGARSRCHRARAPG